MPRLISISDGAIPQDSFTYHRVNAAPNIPSLVLIMIATVAGLFVALGFLGFNIYYRNNRYWQMYIILIISIVQFRLLGVQRVGESSYFNG